MVGLESGWAASGTPGRCNATRRAAEVTADSCASLVGMVDTADELLRAELQRAIWEYLQRTEGSAPEVEISEWSRVDEPSLPSQESSYRGEVFLSLPRLRDDANRKDLHEAAERLRHGFELGVVDTRLKNVAVEELPPGVFNDEGGKRVTLGLWLRVHV
jgi:hypothetical protein